MAFSTSAIWEVQPSGIDDFKAVSAVVAVGGAGYAVNDVLTVSGGTSTTTATFTVTAVLAGVVTTVALARAGDYTVPPANAVATTVAPAGGTGCTLTVTWNAGGNGGGFDPSATFPTDGAATSANTDSPVFTSASYNFVAGDVGAWIFIKSGTNWTPGYYNIVSVAANAATLSAAVGAAIRGITDGTNIVPVGPTTVIGCATVASPTTATWGIDYSQSATPILSFTDIVIDGTTNTKFTSAGNPVGKNFIGNIVCVTGGTGFTIQRVLVVSTVTTTATCDKSLGTLSSTGGTGNLGGALGSPGQAGGLIPSNGMNQVWMKSGTYSIISTTANVPGGKVADNIGGGGRWEGYGSLRTDLGTSSILRASGIASATLFFGNSNLFTAVYRNFTVDGNSLTAIRGLQVSTTAMVHLVKAMNCTNGGLLDNASSNISTFLRCIATGCTTSGVGITAKTAIECESYSNTVDGFNSFGNGGSLFVHCISRNNSGATSDGFSGQGGLYIGCTSYGNGNAGFLGGANGGNTYVRCIAESNTGFGFQPTAPAFQSTLINCAVYLNTAGNLALVTYGCVVGLVTGGGSFFTNAAGGDFSLNNTAGAGAAARSIATIFPAGTTTGYPDIGAARHADPVVAASSHGIGIR